MQWNMHMSPVAPREGPGFAVGDFHWSSPTGQPSATGLEWRGHPRARPEERDIPPHRLAAAY